MPEPTKSPTTEPDLVDRVFDYLLEAFPHLQGTDVASAKRAVRSEFSGEKVRIPNQSQRERAELATAVLTLFNGRNASEVARRLGIGRTTVYRLIKQAAGGNRKIVPLLPQSGTPNTLRSASTATPTTRSRKAKPEPAAWPSPSLISTPSIAPSPAASSRSPTTEEPSPIAR